jgi:hypothetical protein
LKKKHAEHNEAVCDFLLSSGDYYDWVTTTAFYSALHFVQHEIFPLNEGGKTYPDFNTYFQKVSKNNNKKANKHSATIELVKKYIPSASSYYRWLYDTCMNSRYVSYQVSERKAIMAKSLLVSLKKELKK